MTGFKILYFFVLVFSVMTIFLNIGYFRRIPRIPGDLDIDKFGFRIYIPVASAIAMTILLTLLWNYFL